MIVDNKKCGIRYVVVNTGFLQIVAQTEHHTRCNIVSEINFSKIKVPVNEV